jgi:hypothetical protein
MSIFTSVRAMVPCGSRPCRPGHWASEYPRRSDTWHANRCQTRSARASAVYSPHLVNWHIERRTARFRVFCDSSWKYRAYEGARAGGDGSTHTWCAIPTLPSHRPSLVQLSHSHRLLLLELSHPSQAHWKLVEDTDHSSGTGCSKGHDARMG